MILSTKIVSKQFAVPSDVALRYKAKGLNITKENPDREQADRHSDGSAGRLAGRPEGRPDRRTDGRTDGRADGRTDGRTVRNPKIRN